MNKTWHDNISFQQYKLRYKMMTLLSPNERWDKHTFLIIIFLFFMNLHKNMQNFAITIVL